MTILAANEPSEALFRQDEAKLRGSTLAQFVSPQDFDRIVAAASMTADPNHGIEQIEHCKLRMADGAVCHVDLSISRSPDREILIFSCTDIAARLKIEEQLRQAQKVEAVGMLAGGIAHDFNNLLTIISGYTQMLQGSTHLTTDRDRTAVEQVLKASERAADLTTQLLAFSRRQSIQPKILDPNQVIDQTALMLRRLIGEHIELRIQHAPHIGRIHADAGQIQQVIMNLAINSRDAMPSGGVLLIGATNADVRAEDGSKFIEAKPGPYVVITVSDSGTGMDRATQKRVFEPFFTTKGHAGTGLGLSTVYGIVKQYGGVVCLYSEEGHGTTFKVYLPRVDGAAAVEPPPPVEAAGGHETILLVEDEEDVRRMLVSALERRGYEVLVAGGGPEAIDVAAGHAGAVDLLVTDMVMPQMNGRELAVKLREARPLLSLLFMSGYTNETLSLTGILEGQSAFLQKPFAPAALARRVRELLDEGKAERNTAGR